MASVPTTGSAPPLDHVLAEVVSREGRGVPVVLAGSAISVGAPAGLPTVRQFYQLFAEELSARDPIVGDPVKLASRLVARRQFEMLMDEIHSTLPERSHNLHSVASPQLPFVASMLCHVFGGGRPNTNHSTLVSLAAKGDLKLILTTNFDRLICTSHPHCRAVVTDQEFEQLAEDLKSGKSFRPTVAHLHGCVTVPESLVAMMRQVGKPLTGAKAEVLAECQQRGILVFIGYSAGDEDIWPLVTTATTSWALVRKGRKDAWRHGPKKLEVELDPLPGSTSGARRRLAECLDELLPSDRDKLVGTVLRAAGRTLDGAGRLRRGQERTWSVSGALAYADFLAGHHMHEHVMELLSMDPVDATREELFAWMDTRAFSKRHTGDYRGAAVEYSSLRHQLTAVSLRDPLVLPDLLAVTYHEVESRLLIASATHGLRRKRQLALIAALLDKCRGWISQASYVPPMWELDYLAAEHALLCQRYTDAVNAYRAAEQKSQRWFRESSLAQIELRESVALVACGQRWKAVAAWTGGVQAGVKAYSFMNVVQYILVIPVLLGAPTSWYWWLRRHAPRLYRAYGKVKFSLLWVLSRDALPPPRVRHACR